MDNSYSAHLGSWNSVATEKMKQLKDFEDILANLFKDFAVEIRYKIEVSNAERLM